MTSVCNSLFGTMEFSHTSSNFPDTVKLGLFNCLNVIFPDSISRSRSITETSLIYLNWITGFFHTISNRVARGNQKYLADVTYQRHEVRPPIMKSSAIFQFFPKNFTNSAHTKMIWGWQRKMLYFDILQQMFFSLW